VSGEAATPPLLRVNNLEVVYHHSIQVLKGLSLAVPEGAIVALLGSNGAGKTTTLKAISGLLPLEEGEIVDGDIAFRGEPLEGLLPHQIARRGLFQVMEGRRIFEELTVEENLECAAWARPGARRLEEDFRKVYQYFRGLRERRRQLGGTLSGGEQQMLAIGRAVVARPRLLLLDEPSLGLSPLLTQEIFRIIQRINREEGVSILLVEQNAHMALAVAGYGYIMENGKVVLDGPSERLRQDPDVQEFYLGRHGGGRRSYREVKHYKRRKRWLS
jgi:branched-chain amino acid transport system ATP-binding protein